MSSKAEIHTTLQRQRQDKLHLKTDHCGHFANIPPYLHFTKLARRITILDWKEHHQSKYIEFSGCRICSERRPSDACVCF